MAGGLLGGGKGGESQDEGLATAAMLVGALGGILSALAFIAPALGIAGAALAIIALILTLLSQQITKIITVDFKCYAWQPPSGGADCKKCGSDGLPCSKYSCASLGQTCQLINEGNPEVECFDNNPNDAAAPVITPLYGNITSGYNYTNVSENGFKISSKQECLRAYTPVTFGIATSEPAQCKLDTNHTAKFEDMSDDFGTNLYLRNQTATINMPSLESLGVSGFEPNRSASYDIYVRCQDANGNKNVKEYDINFCIAPGDDITVPVVVKRTPQLEYVKYGATELNGSVYINEPSECRFDERDVDYDEMNNSFTCNTGFLPTDINGWRCDTTFPVTKNESGFSVRCKDQPWFAGTNESKRNANTESYKFVVKESLSPLSIDSIEPDNDTVITSGVQPVTIEVEARTSGGMDGTATCYYLIGNQSILFYDTIGKKVHKNIFDQFLPGQFSLPLKCADPAGNTAEKTARFSIRIDTDAPEITRIYADRGGLVIITNENSQCSYVTSTKRTEDECDFDFNNATSMSGTELYHTSDFSNGATYYIKCKDDYGNKLGTCNAIVRGGWTV